MVTNLEKIKWARNPNKYPETWIPTTKNPSKLQLHVFVNGIWEPTVYHRFCSLA